MRILVVGGNGFIGTPLVRELLHGGHDVAVLHRSAGATPNPGAVQIQGDRNRLQDCESEIRAFGPQLMIDMILSSGSQAEQLVAVAQRLNARVVAISSMDVYRAWGVLLGTEAGELESIPITEDSAVRNGSRMYPPDVTAKLKTIFSWLDPNYDKVAVEEAVRSGGSVNTIIRLPMIYGPGDPLHRMYGVLKRIADARPAIILPDDHAAWRGPRGYLENVAHAIALAATSDGAWGRTYHVCEEPALPEIQWQKSIAAQTGWVGRFVVMPRQKTPKHLIAPFNAAQHVVANCERIRTELGYNEVVTREAAIRQTIEWQQANPPAGPSFHQFDYAEEDAALAQSDV